MGFHSTYLDILFLIIVIQASVRLAISTCVPKEMDNCTGEKPFFCAHHCMCYGPGEFCEKEESKVQDCLPSDDAEALKICTENGYNVSATTSAQCSMACFHRFPPKLHDNESRPERLMDNCTGEKPLFCAHLRMCYSFGQFCSKEESRIQDCLPSDDAEALKICTENGNDVSATSSAQCSMACFHRFPPKLHDNEPRPEGSGIIMTDLVIVLGTVFIFLLLALVALGIFIWKKLRKERKEITAEKVKIDNKETDGGRDVETYGQVLDKRAIRQLSQEVAEPDHEDTSEETSLMCAITTTERQQGQHPNISSNGLGTSEMPRSCRVEITGGSQCAEGQAAVGDSNIHGSRTVQGDSASNQRGPVCEQLLQMPAEQRSSGSCVPSGAAYKKRGLH